jgi:two-component system, NtrC family, sensor histidine kinase KinB
MKIKQKLLLGIGILFTMILLLTTLSIVYINQLTADTKNILVANYNTLDYARKMELALNDGITVADNLTLFETNLAFQQKNITEPGEQELTDSLTANFNRLKKETTDISLLHQLRRNIADLVLLNMLAIQRKSKLAEITANQSIFWITLSGTVCFIIALVMWFNLPGNIANPVQEFTQSIKEIAAKNYSRRIHFHKKNEFGELADSFNTMAEKLEEYQASNVQKLLTEKKRIETLINNMRDPVIGLDEKNKILFMNDIALKTAGLKAADVINKSVQEVAMQNDLIRSLIQDVYGEGNKNETLKVPLKIYADNKESYFEKDIIPIKIIPTGEKEEIQMGTVILLQNITSYKELDFAKTNFIATVSHELKTPISSVKLSLQLLENPQIGELNDDQKNLLNSIKEDTARLLKITGELLNITQVEAGKIQLIAQPVSVLEIIGNAINANRSAAENKNILLHVSVPEHVPHLIADKEKTSWVISNLVSNAIRYSYHNATVLITAAEENEKIKISVTDTGQGIAPEYLDKIFERYYRIPGTKKEGTGLGLSISKEFMEAQGGYIEVKSEFGAGSTFSVTVNSSPANA